MSRYIISGGKPLQGEVSIRGAKNASFKEIIATLLSDESSTITNLPLISDVRITQSIAESLGSKIENLGQHSIVITSSKITNSVIPSGTGEKSRTSFIFAGPLLARTGTITFPVPGGDKLGSRPLDRLFECLTQMNVKVTENETSVTLTTSGLIGADYTFPKPSHTSTEVVLMAATCADGNTIIRNAAREPEIDDLIAMLNSMGAKINRDQSNPSTIYITGVKKLHGTTHQVICDRNEAVTFGCAALATKGSVSILRVDPKAIQTFLTTIKKIGAFVNTGNDEVLISWTKPLKAINIETEPEPGFMTDWQAIFCLVLSQSIGCSSIIERIFPSRFQHIDILNLMGVKTKLFNPEVKDFDSYYHFNLKSDRPEYFHGVKIYGPSPLKSAHIEVKDLRAGATATIAAIAAPGESIIEGVEYIERGYEKLADRLRSLGANIEYIKT